ncbi:MAG: hypothetical protein GY799_29455 [Desulfobulbaceae bacterium]|nr:hypothetical protein [Desulfobulbaceae bacterium]
MVTAWSKEAQQEQRPGMGLKPVREILGADDAAGIFIMLRMIENNIPGTYIFHADEEIGCVGSSALADGEYTIDGYDLLTDYDVAIAFDRRGTQDFIHRQLGQEMCSGAFQFELCKRLNTGTILNYRGAEGCITDTAMYADLVPECINLSVGYYDEHSEDERLDYGHLCALLLVILEDHKLFENLPVVRELPEPDGEFDWENDPDQYDAIDDWELPTNLPDLVRSFPDAVTDILEGMGYDYNEVLYTLDEMNQLP